MINKQKQHNLEERMSIRRSYGQEKYCRHCWACNNGVKCIASSITRSRDLLCLKAEARMKGISYQAPEKPVSIVEESKPGDSLAVKKYFEYIQKRIAYLEIISGGIPSNEHKYYCVLQDEIKKWGKSHVVFFRCLTKRITTTEGRRIIGVSSRTFFRMMSRQRNGLIKFITKQEKVLSEKYPFIPFTDAFEEK